jgi:cytochrome c biogenesis protein CcmG/thiol:disulfide interchange protein DsbE
VSLDNKMTWHGLMALLLVFGVAWIVINRVPDDVAQARNERPPSPQVGFAAPDFSLQTPDGETVALSDLRGQVVLINFWATWCGPCRAEMPAIQHVYDEYANQGFTVLAINIQEGEGQVAPFVDQFELTFPVLLDRDGSVFTRYQGRALPTTLFIDRTGVVHEVTLGGPMAVAFIESQVADLLSEGEEE